VANTLLTNQIITFTTLRILKNSLKFAGQVYRGYDDEFGQAGHKIGATLNIRKPARFIGRVGQAVNIEALSDTYTPLVLTTQRGVDFQASSAEMKLSIDDFKRRYLLGAAANIANNIDRDGLLMAYQATPNLVGVAGSTPNALLTYLQSGQKLDELACPDDERRNFIINPAARVGIVDALKGLFQDSGQIAQQYKTGKMGHTAGATWFQDQNVILHTIGTTNGNPTAATVVGAGQTGNTLLTTGWTAADTLNVGEVLTLGTTTGIVYALNPQSRQSTGSPQQFVVIAPFVAVGGGANENIQIFPAITPGGQFQNVSQSPLNGAAINIWPGVNSPNGKQTPQNLLFHEEAFTLACVELEVPDGIDIGWSARDKDTGVALRFIRQYQVTTDQRVSRFDVLYGWAPLYPEAMACRIAG
jgi:P22 coat protein - gene protein 5